MELEDIVDPMEAAMTQPQQQQQQDPRPGVSGVTPLSTNDNNNSTNVNTRVNPVPPVVDITGDGGAVTAGGGKHPGALDSNTVSGLFSTFQSSMEKMTTMLETSHSNFLKQNEQLMLQQQTAGTVSKRPAETSVVDVQEPDVNDQSWWLKGTHTISDNSVDVLDWKIRLQLKNPNCSPGTWWPGTEKGARVAAPIRTTSLYLDHLMGSRTPHFSTIRAAHNKISHLSVKLLLTQNNGACGEKKMKLLVSNNETDTDGMAVRIDKNWQEPKSVHEIVEGVMSMMGIEHQIHPHSFQFMALLRALHQIRLAKYELTQTGIWWEWGWIYV